MQVWFLDRTYNYSNDSGSVKELFNNIDNLLADPQYILAGIIIDNMEIYENYNEYIIERIDEIKTIKVVIDTVENTIDSILESMSKYLDRAVPELELLTGDFYTGEDEEVSIEKLGQLAEGIQWILNMIYYVDKNKALHSILESSDIWNECISCRTRLNEEFNNLKEAIGCIDMILIADILKYEVIDVFTTMNQCIKQIYGHGDEENGN
jgi:hypothetical protein